MIDKLRYRAPVRDRHALGPLGNPFAALVTASGGLIVAALAQQFLTNLLALAVYLLLDAAALIWLRLVLHLGLMQEASEIRTGEDITCANCGQRTPRHAFCINCGVSLLALPKSRRPGSGPEVPSDPGPAPDPGPGTPGGSS